MCELILNVSVEKTIMCQRINLQFSSHLTIIFSFFFLLRKRKSIIIFFFPKNEKQTQWKESALSTKLELWNPNSEVVLLAKKEASRRCWVSQLPHLQPSSSLQNPTFQSPNPHSMALRSKSTFACLPRGSPSLHRRR